MAEGGHQPSGPSSWSRAFVAPQEEEPNVSAKSIKLPPCRIPSDLQNGSVTLCLKLHILSKQGDASVSAHQTLPGRLPVRTQLSPR